MRKRSGYQPKPVRPDAHEHLINGFLPLRAATNEVMRLRVINHGAMERVVSGKATRAEAVDLRNVFITARSLAEIGVGSDYLDEFKAAQMAVIALILRGQASGKYLFTGPELTAVNLGMEVHDLQMDNCTIEVFEQAIKRAVANKDAGVPA